MSWKSSKQTCIARSTMESGEEVEWLHHFLEDIPIWPQPMPAICIMTIEYIRSKENIADSLTKGLTKE